MSKPEHEWSWSQFAIGVGMIHRKYVKHFVVSLGFWRVWWTFRK